MSVKRKHTDTVSPSHSEQKQKQPAIRADPLHSVDFATLHTKPAKEWAQVLQQARESKVLPRVISIYNFKGGVGKTTSTYHLAKTLARRGHRVMVADLDPQCNLTELCFKLDESRKKEKKEAVALDISRLWNVLIGGHTGSSFAFTDLVDIEVEPALADPAIKIKLLPGSLQTMFMDLDTQLALARHSSIPQFENVQGGLMSLIQLVALACRAQVVLLDLNPSASLLNRNLLMASSGIILPCLPDDFSMMALENLDKVLPEWLKEAKEMQEKTKAHLFPYTTQLQFMGLVINHGLRSYTDVMAITDKIKKAWAVLLKKHNITALEDVCCVPFKIDNECMKTLARQLMTLVIR